MMVETTVAATIDALLEWCKYSEPSPMSLFCSNGTLRDGYDGFLDTEIICPACKGRGKVISADGRDVISALKEYL